MAVGDGGLQSFFSFMANHHALVEDIFRLGMKSQWIVNERDILEKARRHSRTESEDHQHLLNRMLDFRVISEFEAGTYEIQPEFYKFLQWLLKERQMFGQGFLQSCIDRMRISQTKIEEEYNPPDNERQKAKIVIRFELKNIIEAMTDLSQFTKSNRDSIILATRTVDDDASFESKLARYIEIQRLYEEYVEPARRMVEAQFAEVCDSVSRTVEETQLRFFEDEDTHALVHMIVVKLITLRQLVSEAHYDMWNELRTAMQHYSAFIELYQGSLIAQKAILQSGMRHIDPAISRTLRVVSMRPRNLFTNPALESYLAGLSHAEYHVPQFELPDEATIAAPQMPINTTTLFSELDEMESTEDLLQTVLDRHPENDLEQCFIAAIELSEKHKENVELTNLKKKYEKGRLALRFNAIRWGITN